MLRDIAHRIRDAARFYANALQRDSRNANGINAHYVYAASDCESARRGAHTCAQQQEDSGAYYYGENLYLY